MSLNKWSWVMWPELIIEYYNMQSENVLFIIVILCVTINQYPSFQKTFFKLEIYKILFYNNLSVSHFRGYDSDTYPIPMQIASRYFE